MLWTVVKISDYRSSVLVGLLETDAYSVKKAELSTFSASLH